MLKKLKREFLCDIGEKITVNVTAAGTADAVAFSKDGETWDGEPFIFTEPADEFTSITLFMVFSNPSGGSYDIEIFGHPDEFVHTETAEQDQEEGPLEDTARGYFFSKKT